MTECITLPGLSDHKMLSAECNLNIIPYKTSTFSCRSYRGFNREQYVHDLAQIDWSFIVNDRDTENIWSKWKNIMHNIISKHTQMITYSQGKKVKLKPWMNSDALNAIRRKHAAILIKDYTPTLENMEHCRKMKKESDKAVLLAKQRHYHGSIEQNVKNPRKLWKIMKDIEPAINKKDTSKETTLTAEKFADYYESMYNGDSTRIDSERQKVWNRTDAFELRNCTQEEVLKVINNISINKADGIDGIPMKCIKLGIDELLEPLSHLMNKFMSIGFPKELKTAIVLPIHKKGPHDMVENYRPISILPGISKLAERLIANQLNDHLNANDLMSPAQHGFRQAHSTNTALLHITEHVRQSLDVGKAVGLVALDLSRAFDTIDHELLIRKLKNFDFGYGLITFMIDYLTDRAQMVKYGNGTSRLYPMKIGVPQGSILGPLLFTLFMNDLPRVVCDSQVVLYADDTTIYSGSRYPSNIQVNLARDLRSIEKWFGDNKLKLNAGKTEYMLITNGHNRVYYRSIKVKVGGKIISEKEKVKVLGVWLSNDLSWDAHTGYLINNLKFAFRSFCRSCKLLSTDSRKLLYNAVIASRLNYCDSVWDVCGVNNKNRLQTIQNRCARVVLGCSPGTSAPPLLQELGWLSLEYKRKLHKCVMMFKLNRGDGPQILVQMLERLKNKKTKTTRGTANENLVLTTHNTKYWGNSFFYETVKLWNDLPLSLRQTKNKITFKDKLNKHFLSKMIEDRRSGSLS